MNHKSFSKWGCGFRDEKLFFAKEWFSEERLILWPLDGLLLDFEYKKLLRNSSELAPLTLLFVDFAATIHKFYSFKILQSQF